MQQRYRAGCLLRCSKLAAMNKNLKGRGRYDEVLATEGLFEAEPAP
jgi:hypothetical protein